MSTLDTKTQKDSSLPYPGPAYPLHSQQEIDLLALFDVLWKAKKLILILVFCFAILGFALSWLLPQKWTSNAIVTPAEPTQLSPLNKMLAITQGLDVDTGVDSNSIFNMFIKKFKSSVLLDQYVKSTPEIMEPFKDIVVDPSALHRAIVSMSEKLKAVNDTSNKKEDAMPYTSWTLSFTGPNPEESQMILNGYINFVANTVAKQTISNIHEAVAMKIQVEKQGLEIDRAQMENTKNTKIKRLNYSLEVAKAAGINKPVYSNGQVIKDDPDFSVSLGSDGINKKLEIEKSIKDVSELNADILNREYLLKQLEELNIKNIPFPVVNFQLSPTLPLKKDGPSRMLVILLAMTVGGMIGCGVVLLQNARESRHGTDDAGLKHSLSNTN